MRRFAFAVASFALFAGTSALAQVGDIGYEAGSSYRTFGTSCTSSVCFRDNPLPEGDGHFPDTVGATGGATYNSYVDIGAAAITFESSNVASQGPFLSFTSSSTVEFDFTNPLSRPIDFHSEITPQGLGMYLANTSGGCLFLNECDQVSDRDFQFSQLNALGTATNGVLGGVGFNFEIFIDGGEAAYTKSGFLNLVRDPDFCGSLQPVCFDDGLGYMGDGPSAPPTGARSLNGFGMDTHPRDFSAIGYSWDATDVLLSLAPGAHFIQYRTTVTSFTNADCLGPSGAVCLVAYSGFGDPIGRGGAIDSLSAFDVGALDHPLGGEFGPITHLGFDPLTFALPVFENNRLVFNPTGTIPEPGTWALMIMGFGFMGAALRRRRIPAHI